MKDTIACCGLDCEKCEARIATINNDDNLRREVADKWAKMNNTPEITPETIHCLGCRSNGVKFYFCSHLCEIRKCVTARGFETCGECSEMENCNKVAMIIGNNSDAKNNLLSEASK